MFYYVMCSVLWVFCVWVLAQSISQVLVEPWLATTAVQSLRAQCEQCQSWRGCGGDNISPLSSPSPQHDSKLSGGSCCSPPSPPGPGRPRPRSVYINIIISVILDHINISVASLHKPLLRFAYLLSACLEPVQHLIKLIKVSHWITQTAIVCTINTTATTTST